MTALWFIPLAMLLWRFQGGAWFAAKLPGRPVWYVIPILALAAWQVSDDGRAAAVTAAGLLAVSFVPHGRWYTLNNEEREAAGKAWPFEAWVEFIGDRGGVRDDHLCLFIAKAIAFLPFALMAAVVYWPFAFLATLFAPLIVLKGYRVGWREYGFGRVSVPTAFGEYATGLAIGLIVLGMGA